MIGYSRKTARSQPRFYGIRVNIHGFAGEAQNKSAKDQSSPSNFNIMRLDIQIYVPCVTR